jgi:hypothetical protein
MAVPDFGAFPIEPRGLAPGLDEVFTPTTRAAPPDPGQDPTVTRLRIWRLGVRIPRGAPPSPQFSGPSPVRLAPGRSCWPAWPATSVWPMPATCGRHRAAAFTRRSRLLGPAPCQGRHPPSGPACPRQSPRRSPARLPATAPTTTSSKPGPPRPASRSLTLSARGTSRLSAGPSGCVAPPDQAFTQNVVGRFGVGEAAGDHLGGEAVGEARGELQAVDRFGGDP